MSNSGLLRASATAKVLKMYREESKNERERIFYKKGERMDMRCTTCIRTSKQKREWLQSVEGRREEGQREERGWREGGEREGRGGEEERRERRREGRGIHTHLYQFRCQYQ